MKLSPTFLSYHMPLSADTADVRQEAHICLELAKHLTALSSNDLVSVRDANLMKWSSTPL